jgi:hypothetical protein
MCICQRVHLVGDDVGKPMGEVHSAAKLYHVVASYGTDWGEWYLCSECLKKTLDRGWECTPIKNNENGKI